MRPLPEPTRSWICCAGPVSGRGTWWGRPWRPPGGASPRRPAGRCRWRAPSPRSPRRSTGATGRCGPAGCGGVSTGPRPGGRWRRPAQVRSLLRRAGVEVPDTRAWRLERLRDTHPLVAALLAWRKAERIATTYGYGWLDEHVGDDGRLPGAWTGCDGAAGRMTASAGLHDMPAELRAAVVAEPGHVFVRATWDRSSPASWPGCRETRPWPERPPLTTCTPRCPGPGVDRPTAKVAVLGAMYGQTTGHGAQALRRLDAAYPVAMAYLAEADRSGRAGRPVRTHGGRLVPWRPPRMPGPASARHGAGPPPRAGTPATRWSRARPPSCSSCGRSWYVPGWRPGATGGSCCASTTNCWSTRRPGPPLRWSAGGGLPGGSGPPVGAGGPRAPGGRRRHGHPLVGRQGVTAPGARRRPRPREAPLHPSASARIPSTSAARRSWCEPRQ